MPDVVTIQFPWERGRLARWNGGQDGRVPRKRQGVNGYSAVRLAIALPVH